MPTTILGARIAPIIVRPDRVSSFDLHSPRRGVTPEESVDVRRYLSAISRSRRMILLILVIVTGTVVGVSLWLPYSYSATASIVLEEDTSAFEASDPESVRRQLNTTQQLLTASSVLESAAARLPGETADGLEDKVSSEVDPEANIVKVSASDGDASRAAAIANTVSETFLSERRASSGAASRSPAKSSRPSSNVSRPTRRPRGSWAPFVSASAS